MPYKDGTGPLGQGPLTGRQMGPCGNGNSGFFGRRGLGRRFRSFFQPLNNTQMKEDIDLYIKELEDELLRVKEEKKRLEEQK